MSGTSCLLPLTQLSQKATAHADLASTPCGMAHKQVSGCSEKSRALPHARREPRNHPSGPCSRFSCQRTVLQNAGGVQIPPAVTVYIDSLLLLAGLPVLPLSRQTALGFAFNLLPRWRMGLMPNSSSLSL